MAASVIGSINSFEDARSVVDTAMDAFERSLDLAKRSLLGYIDDVRGALSDDEEPDLQTALQKLDALEGELADIMKTR